jgi:hypothetical protein
MGMRSISKVLAVAGVAAAAMGLPAAYADDPMNANAFVKMCDSDKDGMVSKQEMMKMMEKMFDKHDTKKQGKLDKQQAEAFLKELAKGGGG